MATSRFLFRRFLDCGAQMLQTCCSAILVGCIAIGCGSSGPKPPETLPKVAYDRYESIRFRVNSTEVRPNKSTTVVKDQKATLEVQFRRVVFWKDLDDRESSIQVLVIEQGRNGVVERAGQYLSFVASRDGVISFAAEYTNKLSVGRYGLVVAERGTPNLDQAILFSGTLEVAER